MIHASIGKEVVSSISITTDTEFSLCTEQVGRPAYVPKPRGQTTKPSCNSNHALYPGSFEFAS